MKKAIKGSTITFTFGEGVEPVTFTANKVQRNLRDYAEMHGWAAKIGDNAAISTKRAEGDYRPVTEAERRAAILETVEYFEGGATTWNRTKRAARAPAVTPAITALATALGMTYAQAEAHIANMALEAMTHPDRTSL